MNLYKLADGNKEKLKYLLSYFYSVGQLQITYETLTDSGKIPDMSDKERADRTEAIAELLGKNQQPIHIEKPAKRKAKK